MGGQVGAWVELSPLTKGRGGSEAKHAHSWRQGTSWEIRSPRF